MTEIIHRDRISISLDISDFDTEFERFDRDRNFYNAAIITNHRRIIGERADRGADDQTYKMRARATIPAWSEKRTIEWSLFIRPRARYRPDYRFINPNLASVDK